MAVLDRVPVDRITVEAHNVHVGRALLAVLLGVFYVVGWVAGKIMLGLAVVGVAVKLGWVDARSGGAGRGTG